MGHVRDLPKERLAVDVVRGLRRRVRGAQGAEEGRRRAAGGGARGGDGLPRRRPRPRGRGDLLAPRRDARWPRRALPTRGLPRGDAARGAGGLRRPARDRRAPCRRAADAPRRRPARRLQPQPAPVAHGAAGALGRARPVGGAAPRVRPRAAREVPSGPRSTGTSASTSTPGRRPSSPPSSCASARRTPTCAPRRRPRPLRGALEARATAWAASSAARGAARRRRPSSPRRCSRRRSGGFASPSRRRCRWRSGSTRASSCRGRGRWGSSPTCARTRCASRPRPPRRPASTSLACTARRSCPRRRTPSAPSSSAQDAHEAIRPTDLARSPASLRGLLPKDELALYTLVFERFVASQMAAAVYDETIVDVEARPKDAADTAPPAHGLRAKGSAPALPRVPRRVRRGSRRAGRGRDGRAPGRRRRRPIGPSPCRRSSPDSRSRSCAPRPSSASPSRRRASRRRAS